MSDFASFVTEPFWPDGQYAAVADWFRDEGWTEIKIDDGSGKLAFADIICDGDAYSAWDVAKGTIAEIAKLLSEKADLCITGLDESTQGRYDPVVLSVSGHRSDIKWQAEIDARRIKAEVEAKARVSRYDIQNPELDDFLAKDAFLQRTLGDAYNAQGLDEYLWS